MPSPQERLRTYAVTQTLNQVASLEVAMARLGFVQADPIRSPATAQDLILRHRVAGYTAGDLDRSYVSLGLDEDYLYAYGFLPRGIGRLLHPRRAEKLDRLEREVLEVVRVRGQVHPKDLEGRFGRRRVVNAWGGQSKATTRSLDALHFRGLLRIARREGGTRVYEPALPRDHEIEPEQRVRNLVLVIAGLLAPVPVRTLKPIASGLCRAILGSRARTRPLEDLLRSGELQKRSFDAIEYVWPGPGTPVDDAPRIVRFLAPFDPVVWDRRRFEHLWGWPYRFEAYTPRSRRIRGYYAMPLLWGDRIVGWANASHSGGKLDVDLGFVDGRPKDGAFRSETDAEIARLETFLAIGRPLLPVPPARRRLP